MYIIQNEFCLIKHFVIIYLGIYLNSKTNTIKIKIK